MTRYSSLSGSSSEVRPGRLAKALLVATFGLQAFLHLGVPFHQSLALLAQLDGRGPLLPLLLCRPDVGGPIEPRLIVVEIEGKDTSKTLAYAGKGLTFDTGGISFEVGNVVSTLLSVEHFQCADIKRYRDPLPERIV